VQGAWQLHRLTESQELDFMVFFSSSASLLGSPGQGNYAAANAFMDGLAHHRRARGLPGISINWGPWSEAGMAADTARRNQKRWAALGMSTIPPEKGLETLGQLLPRDLPQVAVLPVDWNKLTRGLAIGLEPGLLRDLTREVREQQGPPELARRLEEAPPNERWGLVVAHVRGQAVRLLRLDPENPPELRQPLHELGLDSLMAVEMRNALILTVGRPLPITLLFDYPTIESLAGYLGREVLGLEMGPPAPPETVDDRALAEVERLSEEELDAHLAGKIEQLADVEQISEEDLDVKIGELIEQAMRADSES
jgi:myxalamid-type polyketide synthase MxaC